ncbi:hypothetical protein RM50_04285 [Pseudarthrobacter phenanthrenivorans]|uniref:Uncharacterized protein n=1 Tax=Pseudarthrobacter phenanthrenivorans TaxID=361575 RepID=A0A0B4D5Q6_PSEPS|nr:hypothetical protein RM50_04285 [Pseudarthrobacter phenanthrenivorans]
MAADGRPVEPVSGELGYTLVLHCKQLSGFDQLLDVCGVRVLRIKELCHLLESQCVPGDFGPPTLLGSDRAFMDSIMVKHRRILSVVASGATQPTTSEGCVSRSKPLSQPRTAESAREALIGAQRGMHPLLEGTP